MMKMPKIAPNPNIYIKKIRYIAVKKLVERSDPFHIPTTQRYTPASKPQSLLGLIFKSRKLEVRRVIRRKVTIKLENPAPYEIHLANETVTESLINIDDPKNNIAMYFDIKGNTKQLLNNRKSSTGVYFFEDRAYFVLRWDDVLYNPMKEKEYKGASQTKRKLDRNQYPMDRFGRKEKRCHVHYLTIASETEQTLIVAAIKAYFNK